MILKEDTMLALEASNQRLREVIAGIEGEIARAKALTEILRNQTTKVREELNKRGIEK